VIEGGQTCTTVEGQMFTQMCNGINHKHAYPLADVVGVAQPAQSRCAVHVDNHGTPRGTVSSGDCYVVVSNRLPIDKVAGWKIEQMGAVVFRHTINQCGPY